MSARRFSSRCVPVAAADAARAGASRVAHALVRVHVLQAADALLGLHGSGAVQFLADFPLDGMRPGAAQRIVASVVLGPAAGVDLVRRMRSDRIGDVVQAIAGARDNAGAATLRCSSPCAACRRARCLACARPCPQRARGVRGGLVERRHAQSVARLTAGSRADASQALPSSVSRRRSTRRSRVRCWFFCTCWVVRLRRAQRARAADDAHAPRVMGAQMTTKRALRRAQRLELRFGRSWRSTLRWCVCGALALCGDVTLRATDGRVRRARARSPARARLRTLRGRDRCCAPVPTPSWQDVAFDLSSAPPYGRAIVSSRVLEALVRAAVAMPSGGVAAATAEAARALFARVRGCLRVPSSLPCVTAAVHVRASVRAGACVVEAASGIGCACVRERAARAACGRHAWHPAAGASLWRAQSWRARWAHSCGRAAVVVDSRRCDNRA